jgi:predicted Zn-dependent protease
MMKPFAYCLVLLALCIPACVKNAEGRSAFALMPAGYLQSQATLAYNQQKDEVPISGNRRHSAIVDRVANRLIDIAKADYAQYSQGFAWETTLFEKDDTVNAYCMPGGKIGIYSGILPVCETEAGLAAVMGHEIAHALLKHGNERVTQQLTASIGLAALEIGLNENPKMDGQVRGMIMQGVGIGAQLGVLLPFSRYHESEADRMGLRIMAKAGYDPKESVALWQRMKAKSGGQAPPVILSTHPSNDQRIAALSKLQAEVQPLYNAAPRKYGLGDSF